MRLAVLLDQPFFFDGKQYFTNATVVDFILSFKEYFEEMVLFVPVKQTDYAEGFHKVIMDEKIRFVALPFFHNAREMYLSTIRLVPQVTKIFRREIGSWDVAWVFWSHFLSLIFIKIAKENGKKFFLYVRSDIVKEAESYRFNFLLGSLVRFIVRTVNQIHMQALSRNTPVFAVSEKLAKDYRLVSDRVFHLCFASIVKEGEIVTSRIEPGGDFTIVVVGRITQEKNLELLIDAVDILVRDSLSVKCKIVGTGKEEDRIRKLVIERGLGKHVEFTGFVPYGKELFEQYDAAHVYVISSHTEGMPKTILEAMARGLPIVATNVGGISEVIVNGENGLLVPPGDPRSLAAAIKHMAINQGLRESCGKANIEKAKEFNIQKQRTRWVKIINDEIINKKARLAVVIDQPFWFDGKRYFTNATIIKFILSFKEYFEEIILFVPMSRGAKSKGYSFEIKVDDKIRFIELPFFNNALEMYKLLPFIFPRIRAIIKKELDSWDIAWVTWAHLLSILFYKISLNHHKKVFLYVRSNILKEVESHKFNGVKALFYKRLAAFIDQVHIRFVKQGNQAFVVGKELLDIYGNNSSGVYEVYESIVTNGDILESKKKSGGEFTLICVGRLTPEKGVDLLIKAMDLLVGKNGLKIKCKIVGEGKEETPLREMVANRGLEPYFEFVGFIPPGEDLYRQYDSADIYVLPSYTEGLPKTIYEAMARGLPIVATDVGGVSEIVSDHENGLVVPPNDSVKLAAAIKQLVLNKGMRELFQFNNIKKIKGFTMDRQRDRMFSYIKQNIIDKSS